jgi:hypothetical protein
MCTMAAGVPMYKGMGFGPVIVSLKAHPRGAGEVPASLQHYLEDDVVVTGWYPESDFIAMVECLARILQRDGVQDVWSYFGRVAAQRDLLGDQRGIPEARRVRVAGLYRRLASDEVLSLASWLGRAATLWSLYHDTGRMVIGTADAVSCGAVFRLYNPPPLPPHIIELNTAYYIEFARIAELPGAVRFAGEKPGPNGYLEWEVQCEPDPELEASLATLPRFRP